MPLALPFRSGDLVVVVLQQPRERLWGRLLRLDAAGISLRGLDLSPWEEVLSLVRTGQLDQVALGTRFVPMHRVEAMHLDAPGTGVPSLGELFQSRTGLDPAAFLADVPTAPIRAPRRRRQP